MRTYRTLRIFPVLLRTLTQYSVPNDKPIPVVKYGEVLRTSTEYMHAVEWGTRCPVQ